jgi:hypothetical protein
MAIAVQCGIPAYYIDIWRNNPQVARLKCLVTTRFGRDRRPSNEAEGLLWLVYHDLKPSQTA